MEEESASRVEERGAHTLCQTRRHIETQTETWRHRDGDGDRDSDRDRETQKIERI